MEINLEGLIAYLKSRGVDTSEAEEFLESICKEKTALATANSESGAVVTH